MPRSDSRGGATAGDVRHILDSIRRLVRVLRLSARAAEHDVGLSGAQLFVLQTVGRTDGLTLGALATETSTDPSSVSVVVTRLVARGLLKRKHDPDDARKLRLSLTAAGRAVYRRAPSAAQGSLVEALEGLPAPERRALARLLVGLTAKMGIDSDKAPMMFDEEPPAPRRRRPRA